MEHEKRKRHIEKRRQNEKTYRGKTYNEMSTMDEMR